MLGFFFHRAEILKGCAKETTQQSSSNEASKSVGKDTNQRFIPPLGFGAFKCDSVENKAAANAKPQQPLGVSGPGGYTKEEIDVLR